MLVLRVASKLHHFSLLVSFVTATRGLTAEQDVHFFLDPFLRVRSVGVGVALIDQAAQIGKIVDELEQIGDVVRDGRLARARLFQILFKQMAHT